MLAYEQIKSKLSDIIEIMAGKLIIIIMILVVALAIFLYWSLGLNQSNQNINTKGTIWIDNHKLTVDIADEPQEQAQGLSGRENLKENEGMLFIFLIPDKYGFWMKDMKFSLDLIWMDKNLAIVDITKNLSPETFPAVFSSSSPVKYVLEVNAGWSDRNKIKTGDTVVF